MKLLRRKVKVRSDYREFDADRMRTWGHNAFWWPKESHTQMCMFVLPKPVVGDVVIADTTIADGTYHVVEHVHTPMDPGDQHFLTLRPLKKPPAPSKREPSWGRMTWL